MYKTNIKFLLAIFLSSFLSATNAGHHEGAHMEHDEVNHQQNSSSCADDSSCSMAHGVVLSLSKEVSKITLRHGEIPNIDMPPMTMVFTVEDSSLMQNLKEGDHVLFHVENIGGEYIIKDMIEDHH